MKIGGSLPFLTVPQRDHGLGVLPGVELLQVEGVNPLSLPLCHLYSFALDIELGDLV